MRNSFALATTALIKCALAASALIFVLAANASADGVKFGDLMLMDARARATPPSAPVSGGYVTIVNHGAAADRLVSASASFAGKVELHEMAMDGDVMKMREVDGGIEIGPGGTVELKPGGLHIMFMQLGEPLNEGDTHAVTLVFEQAGSVELDFVVTDKAGKSGHSGHSDHSGHSN